MITLYRYALPFVRPVTTRHGPLATRTGVLVRDGHVWGEAAPWPGLSRESLNEAEAGLKIWRNDPQSDRILTPRLSSVVFAVESVRRVPDPASPIKIPVNGLLSDEPLDSALPALRTAGFRTVKIKVGRQSLRADVERVCEVNEQLGPDIKLRLDANRAWTLSDALDFARRIDGISLEYIEEPLQNPTELAQFHNRSGLPVAVDESFWERPITDFTNDCFIHAVIIKPTIIGGLITAERATEFVRHFGWQPVFSAVYESGVGIRELAHLAARCGAPGVAMGLDTYRCLADDVLLPRLTIRDGALDLTEADRAEVCVEKLQELP
ncbi:MAG: o-succinylbenzoate synthase [Kiritimatiellaeota bacterium]|nr:o-succinylbenzoate synthase [Kiritimatiellota bacterium]